MLVTSPCYGHPSLSESEQNRGQCLIITRAHLDANDRRRRSVFAEPLSHLRPGSLCVKGWHPHKSGHPCLSRECSTMPTCVPIGTHLAHPQQPAVLSFWFA
uniref:Uncharacterized protein n=1 Tax=Panagrellus redivivus TaxID=6233 RepID=A0A7E4VZL4_PANRE